MTHALLMIIFAIAVLLIAWLVIARFSPDPLLTQICQIIIFLLALYLIITKILPLAGLSF